jgi:hypothetical protein
MRHASISTTMGYYANVDDAVEEAVLGPRCNRSRNSAAPSAQPAEAAAPQPVAVEVPAAAAGFSQAADPKLL